MADSVAWQGDLAPAEVRRLVGKGDLLILQIGCNDGTDTLRFLAEFPLAVIHCFECDPRPIARFKRNVRCARAVLHETAVGNSDGWRDWHASHGRVPKHAERFPGDVAADWDLSGSLLRPSGHLNYSPWVTFSDESKVPCTRLDTWLGGHAEIRLIDFIWCDVQGAEAEVIAGGTRALSITRWFYTEFYDPTCMGARTEQSSLYEGQPNLATLGALLPDFEAAGYYGHENVLFRNRTLP